MIQIYLIRVPKFVVMVLLLGGCTMDRSEISRVVSPDGQVTAVLIQESGGGAAGASGYYLYLTDSQNGELKRPNFMATGCAGSSLAWIGRGLLRLTYPAKCSIKQFINLWYSPSDIQNARRASVEIVLAKMAE